MEINSGNSGGGGGTALTVTDGVHTVTPVTIIDFTSGATVSNGGGGTADVSITGSGSGTVTSVTSSNTALATVANSTTTPAITILAAPAITSATTTVNTSSATAPTSGQVLTATGSTAATWQTPTTGTVTAVSVASANGFTGTSSGGATPALTLATSLTTPVIAGNGTALIAATTTGSGNVVLATSPTVTLGTSSTAVTQSAGDNSTAVATDAFVTTAIANAIAGNNPAVAVQAATTAASNTSGFTYSNGVSGVSATLTQNSAAVYTVDGFTFTATGQRLLVKNDTQTSPGTVTAGTFNGIYTCTTVGTAIIPAVFTRALDYDTTTDINNTGTIPVINGTVNAQTSWLNTTVLAAVGSGTGNNLVYIQFSYSPTTIIPPSLGGTGIANNAANTLTYSGNFGITETLTATTSVTFPTSGTLVSSVSTANGVSATNTAGALSFTLGAITPSTVNGNTLTTGSSTYTGTAAATYTFPGASATIAGLGTTQTFTGQDKFNNFIDVNNAVTVTSNAGTVPVTFRLNTFTNSSAATMAITMAVTSAVDGQMTIVRIYDFSGVAETIGWTNTENSTVSAPTTSNGSTTLPLTVGFMYNGQTSKWRCIALA